jgi:spore germination cell wall hydrolase CwlJ-like protein
MDDLERHGQQTILVVIVALLAVGIVLALVAGGVDAPPGPVPHRVGHRRIVLPPAPEVPPALFADEAPDIARASNAAVPLMPGPPPAASPFHYQGTAADRAAAEACLTAAVLYEAGDDPPGERAVAQVVLNRLRHPAFPKTVCGVIFQGSERKTGCQFTFTCDGALARPQSAAALERARAIASAALSGAVEKSVGTATHYHTDWVVPYWRSSLDKIAIVHTQIFYRWPGAWGTRAVLAGRLQPGEQPDPRVARMAGLRLDAESPMAEQQAALALPGGLAVAGVPPASLNGNVVRLMDEGAGQFVLQLDPGTRPASYAITGFNLCGDKLECTVFGWTDAREIPRSLPVLPWMMRSLAFVYRKSHTLGIAQGYWDCRRFPRPLPAQCLAN